MFLVSTRVLLAGVAFSGLATAQLVSDCNPLETSKFNSPNLESLLRESGVAS